jgi:uncharacterized protein (TIGR03435 family)
MICKWGAILLSAAACCAQSQPAFEVASIKPSQAADFQRTGMKFLPGRFVATNYPLQVLIAGAYRVPFNSPRLTGGPEWVRSDRYDIEAKADPRATPAEMRLMLRKLLAGRFHLTLHRETKELPVYGMVVAKNGLKLPKAKPDETDTHILLGGQGKGIHGKAADLSDLAIFVENFTDRPVIDKTGVEGLFQIETTGWVPMRPKFGAPEGGADLSILPSLFAVFSQLGLKLEPQKATVEMLVIERVERPTEN